MPTRLPMARFYGAVLWFVVAVVVLVAWLLFSSHAAVLFGDYAQWTFHGVLLRDVLQGHPDAGYILKNYPVPNSFTTLELGLLMLIMPWKIAAKLWLVVELVLGLYAAVQLQRAGGKPQSWQLVVLPAAMLLGTNFWFGFSNFNFGVYFAMLLIALLLRGVRSRWLYGAALLLAFFSHMIPFAFAVLVLALYALQTADWAILLQVLPSAGLSVWYFAGRLLHGNADAHAGMLASVRYGTPAFLAFKINSYLKCWGFINPASTEHDSILLRMVGTGPFLVLFLAAAAVAATVLLLMMRNAKLALAAKSPHRFFWFAVSIFFVVALAMPGAEAGISDPGARMLQVAVWSGVCLVETQLRWVKMTLSICGLLLLGADCYLLQTVALQPPSSGIECGPLPARLRQFAHVPYSYAGRDYTELDQGKMDVDIYPTAMFLQEPK